MAVVSRIRMDEKTEAHVALKASQSHSKLEISRCLKRYLAREVNYLLKPEIPPTTTQPNKTKTRT
jgi:transposase